MVRGLYNGSLMLNIVFLVLLPRVASSLLKLVMTFEETVRFSLAFLLGPPAA